MTVLKFCVYVAFLAAFVFTCVNIAPSLAEAGRNGTATSVEALLSQTTRPVVIAHRGCWEFAPENSLKGIRACINLGVDMVEGDVNSTRDGVLVIMHDPTLDRMTNMSGALKNYTYKELEDARLREGSGGKDAPLTGELVPTLVDWIREAKGKVFLVLHIGDADLNRVFDTVSAEGAERDVLFLLAASPDSPRLQHPRFIGRAAYMPVIVQCSAAAKGPGCYTADEFREGRVAADYKKLHPAGYLTSSDGDLFLKLAATAQMRTPLKVVGNKDEDGADDRREVWAQYLKWNVRIILTDHARLLIEYLKAHKSHG